MAKKYLSKAEAAKKLKVSENVIQEMINTNVFESKMVGKNVKVDEDSLNEWLENLSDRDEKMLALRSFGQSATLKSICVPKTSSWIFRLKTNTMPSASSARKPRI